MKTDKELLIFWEDTAKRSGEEAKYYQEELVKAHALLGRVIHQMSEHWDSVNLTRWYPTDNPIRKRNIRNPTGMTLSKPKGVNDEI